MPKLGLIAGNRQFPIYIAKAARSQGYQVVAVGLREETEPALQQEVDRMHWISFHEIGRIPDLFKEEGVEQLILAGQIRPERLLRREDRFDEVVQGLVKAMPDRSGNAAMRTAVRFLESRGFRVLNSGLFLKHWIPQKTQVLTDREPSREEWMDLRRGLKLARALAAHDVGQTVVVKRKAVAALEALEGTDAAIQRGGRLAGPGCVVVKAVGPRHDMRFDIPVVGVETLEVMFEAGATCLGVQRGRTLLFEREKLIAQANEREISLVAL